MEHITNGYSNANCPKCGKLNMVNPPHECLPPKTQDEAQRITDEISHIIYEADGDKLQLVYELIAESITTLRKESEEAYEKGYGRGLEVGELQSEEAEKDAYRQGLEDAYGVAAKIVTKLV